MVNRRKRNRTIQEESDSDASGDEGASSEPSTSHAQSSKRSKPDTDDANDTDLQDSDDLDCTQPELATNKDEAEVGIIEKVTLVNFMCHTMLEVPLGPNVNFIIGRNGSGKSAIMTALVVGLGGKATVTSRGSSLKGFIKEHCHYALISIKLRNRGLDAYCKDKYGPSITVERRINSDGSGSYKLKSHSGKTVSTKKEELNHILDQFNIQVDNPISVLNQDTSRNFLNSSDPKDKYKFFLKATQLEQISDDYQMVLTHQEVINDMLEKKAKMIPITEKEVKILENKYNDLKQLRTMKDQRLGPLEREVKSKQDKLPRYEAKVEECNAEVLRLESESQAIEAEIETVLKEAREAQPEQTEIEAELKDIKIALRKKESEVRKARQSLRSAEQDMSDLTERISEIKQSALHDREAERRQREETLAKKREDHQAGQNQLNITSHHKDQLNQALSRAKENSYSLKTDVNDAKRAVDATQRNLTNLQSSTRDKLRLFGPWMPDLVNHIQQAARRTRFHRLPVGPIGAHLKLKNQKWALAVESCIKGLAIAFCCTDSHDEQILRQIMKQVCPPNSIPQIIISRFQDRVHDVSRNKPRCKYTTVLDELVVDDPVATNCLIDQLSVESVLLVEDPKEARDVMFFHTPQGAGMAYAINGDQVIGGRSAKYYSATSSSAHFLQQDIEQEIRRLERDLNNKRQQHQQLQDELRQQEANIAENKRELVRTTNKAMREQEVVNRLLEEIKELENFEEEELPDVTTLEEEVVNITQQIAELKEQKTKLEEEFEAIKEKHQKQELKKQRFKEKMEVLLRKHEPLTKKQEETMVEILTAKNNRKHYSDKVQENKDAISKAEKAVVEMTRKIESTSAMAAQYCGSPDKIETKKTVKSLESEILQKEKCIRTEEQKKNHGTHDQITKQYFDALKELEHIKDSLKNLRRFNKRLTNMMKKRTQAYQDYRGFIAIRAAFFFSMMLSQRGYQGKMKFDHKNEALYLQVNVEQGKGRNAKDTRSLSGGERSFSTVSFIMALWEAMESPFRCLDEFDVFMDMVNRRISMQMMLKVAKEQLQRQFILLTPQDMSAIGGGPTVKIFKLRDPERGQTILPFQPVGQINDDEDR
ncbi:structural maintenance of chromosomes protein 6 isoform X4 [Nematostella vectensis]|uniref:structural maintenance of chromosomes protein 6 isoform X4 n=1 Tax=Nematostella vectensis TaxID=45351 RepID=UPI0020773790|nr:structural maintenance of chromosomes protein 6 isoform X4 [Nematostella vectensis]